MSKHVYMSVGQRQVNGKFINPKTKQETLQMRYRGEVPDDHDTDDHIAWMAANGHVVEVHPTIVGEEVEYPNPNNPKIPLRHIEYRMGTRFAH